MTAIYLKPVEYPSGRVLEWEELTPDSIEEMVRQAKELLNSHDYLVRPKHVWEK